MKIELYEKLQQLKVVMRQLDMSARLALLERVRAQLPPEALMTSDGQHVFSVENLLVVALVTSHVNDRNEFDSITGLYNGGYQSELRRCVYHGSNGSKTWSREIHRLYHSVKEHVTVTLPQLREEEEDYVPADAWKVSKF